jgi:hypothetical protein
VLDLVLTERAFADVVVGPVGGLKDAFTDSLLA